MSSLLQIYMLAVGGDVEQPLSKPGPARVAELFGECGLADSEQQVSKAYAEEAWSEDRSFTWSEFEELGVRCGLDGENGQAVGKSGAEVGASKDEESEEALELAALVERVAQRASDRVFPYVLAQELKSPEAAKQAEQDLEFVRTSEFVQLQSFLDRKYEDYRKSCPAELDMPEKARRTAYAMEFYYLHVHEFLCVETLRHRFFRHKFQDGTFVPLISPSMLKTADEKVAAGTCLHNVSAAVSCKHGKYRAFDFCQSFDLALWGKFDAYESMAKYTAKSLEEVLGAFLRSEYYSTMAEVLGEMEEAHPSRLDPAFPVASGGASQEEQQKRLQIIGESEATDGIQVESVLADELKSMMAGMTPEMQSVLPDGFDVAYREKRYFSVLAQVVRDRHEAAAASSPMVIPKVDPQEGCSEAAEVDRRRALVKRLSRSMMSEVDAKVKGMWMSECKVQPHALQSMLPEEPPQAFWVARYYVAVEEVVAASASGIVEIPRSDLLTPQSTTHASNAFPSSSSQENRTGAAQVQDSRVGIHSTEARAGAAQMTSGRVGVQPGGVGSSATFGMQAIMDNIAYDEPGDAIMSEVEQEFVCCRSLLSDAEFASRVRYEGKVVHYDPQPRDTTPRGPSQSPRKRSLVDEDESNIACDLVLVDNTGPVLVTLWGKVATAWYSIVGISAAPFVSLDAMRVASLSAKSTWNGPSLAQIRVLHSTPSGGGVARWDDGHCLGNTKFTLPRVG